MYCVQYIKTKRLGDLVITNILYFMIMGKSKEWIVHSSIIFLQPPIDDTFNDYLRKNLFESDCLKQLLTCGNGVSSRYDYER